MAKFTENQPYPVYQKLVISGEFVERYIYSRNYIVGMPRLYNPRAFIRSKKPNQLSIREDNVRRSRQKIRRLINCNHDMTKFMTLTFDGKRFPDSDFSDLNVANRFFDTFIKRLRRLYPNIKYIAIPEFQKNTGNVHYHLLINLKDYISNDYLSDNLWTYGFAWLRKTHHVDNLGAYVCKYLTKEIFNEKYFKKKKFFYSLNLLKPLVLDRIEDVKAFLKFYFIDLLVPEFKFKVLTDFLGEVYYRKYRLNILKVDI